MKSVFSVNIILLLLIGNINASCKSKEECLKLRPQDSFKHNARNSHLSFEENGFMLFKNHQIISALNTNIDAYEKHIISTIRNLFPEAKTVDVVDTLYRGTGDNHYTRSVHFDYAQSRQAIANRYPSHAALNDLILSNNILWVIGVWTPVQMKTHVCGSSLALLDANTLSKEDIKTRRFKEILHLANGTEYITSGSIATVLHNSNHRWYYYPHMKNDETLIFTHYRSEQLKANCHGTFTPVDCTDDRESRKSIESKVFITFDNECSGKTQSRKQLIN
eukprot:545063_1